MKPTELDNAFKRALAAGRPQLGLWLSLAHPTSAELCAGAGFDWLLIDGEHAPNTLETVLAQLQAVAPYPVAPVVRPPVNDPVLIKQLLDIGVQNLLLPMVQNAAEAAAAVAAVHYPPRGIRGVGSGLARASRWSRVPNYLQRADDEVCVLVQVETLEALRALDHILAVEGVDGVFIGPSDLAASMGHLGQPGHADVRAAVDAALGRIVAAGKAAGLLTFDPAQARRSFEQGAAFVAVGADAALLARAADALAASFKPADA